MLDKPVKTWATRTRRLSWDRLPLLMGIINVTPDSFSDGGHWQEPQRAVDHGRRLLDQGADLLDIGGESTRPYSHPVDVEQELKRTIPVVEGLARIPNAVISIDTAKARVAREAIAAGAEIINDVTGLTGDPDMEQVAVETGAGVCVMHMQGNPRTMQDNPQYDDVVTDIYTYLKRRQQSLTDRGIALEKIALDPGIGFGKTHEHNWELVRRIAEFHSLRSPILVGHSRKGFIKKLTGEDVHLRDLGTLAVSCYLAEQRVSILRLHEVAATRLVFRVGTAARFGFPNGKQTSY